MTPNELTSTEQCMQQKWHDFVMAEQQGASLPVLEYMYNAYIVAVEEHNRSLTRANGMSQVAIPTANTLQVYSDQQLSQALSSLPKTAPHTARKHKKAS